MDHSKIATIDPTNPYDGKEGWKNSGKSTLQVWAFSSVYGQMSATLIRGGQTVHLTPAERRMNQDKVLDPKHDPFTNGTLIPVRIIETEADVEQIRSNPATLTDDQIAELMSGHGNTLKKRLRDISNSVTLMRLLEIGASEAVDASTSKMLAVRERLEEIDPQQAAIIESDEQAARTAAPAMATPGAQGPQAPKGPDAPPMGADIYDDKAFEGAASVG